MLKVAVVGAGLMGYTHAKAYKNIGGIELAAIVELDEKRASALSSELNCIWFRDIEELAGKGIDIIDICVPTPYHKTSIEKASGYVKNIVCEKPLVLKSYEVDDLRRIIEEKDLIFMVAQVIRFWNGYATAKKIIDEGLLGKLSSIVCTRRQKVPVWSEGNWINKREMSGGPTFDLIIHDIDYVTWILGKPDYVQGTELMKGDTCRHVKAELIYKDSTATIFGSLGMPQKFSGGSCFFTLEVIGDRGMISYDSNNKFSLITDTDEKRIEINLSDAYENELRYFVDCVNKRQKPDIANIYQARLPIEISNAIVTSSREKCLVDLR